MWECGVLTTNYFCDSLSCVLGVAVLQGLLFAIGGYLEGKTSTDAVECYNPRTMR